MHCIRLFVAVAMNSRDRYEIIELCKILYSTKQPCSSVCLKNVLNLLENAIPWVTKAKTQIF